MVKGGKNVFNTYFFLFSFIVVFGFGEGRGGEGEGEGSSCNTREDMVEGGEVREEGGWDPWRNQGATIACDSKHRIGRSATA